MLILSLFSAILLKYRQTIQLIQGHPGHHRPQIMKPTMRRTSFASPTQQRKLKRKPSFQSTISETSSPNKRHSIRKFLPTDIKRDSSIDAIHQALEQAGLGEAADKIANLIELSKKASRTGIQEEFFESCNNFKNERDRIQRAALFIDDARNSREIKVERLTSWAVWIYKLEQSPMCSNFFVFVSLLHMYCGVWSPLLRPKTLGHGDLGIFIQPPPYPESQVYIELTCLLLYTLQLSLTVFHSYGSVFFRRKRHINRGFRKNYSSRLKVIEIKSFKVFLFT